MLVPLLRVTGRHTYAMVITVVMMPVLPLRAAGPKSDVMVSMSRADACASAARHWTVRRRGGQHDGADVGVPAARR